MPRGFFLCLGDTALNINLPFDMCRWLVEGEDVEGVKREDQPSSSSGKR